MNRPLKILVLGTGNAQVDLIKQAKIYGMEVHSCSYKKEGKGIQFSDFFTQINITDTNAVIQYVKNNGINLVYSSGSDLAMPTVAAVSEKLNLPSFISFETAQQCNSKSSLRDILKSFPDYSVISMSVENSNDADKWTIFPAMVKPNDSQGQRGISKVENPSQLEKAVDIAKDHSRTNTAIIEEFVEGFEISINSYLTNGDIRFNFISERNSFTNYPGGIIKSHHYPVGRKINSDKIDLMIQSVLKALKIKNGPAYMQVKINEEGNPKIIEVTPRFDGCHLWRLINALYGLNLMDIMLKHLTTGKIDEGAFDNILFPQSVRGDLLFFTSPPNSPFDKGKYEITDNSVYTEWYYNDGEVVREINGYREKTGYQIVLQK